MSQIWTLFKRWGLPLARRVGLAMPLLLAVGAALLLIAIWWLGPDWTWRGQQPLSSIALRSAASLLLLVLPLLIGLIVLRMRFRRLQSQHRQEQATLVDPCLTHVQAQERALGRCMASFLDNVGGRGALYRLPWYLVVGAERAGKSSFIEATGQNFSLTRIDNVQTRALQAGPTAFPVGWWISDDAVIIDPPGGFITQPLADQVPPDASGAEVAPASTQARLWNHLLQWLVRNRSRRAINGLLLVVDLPALLQGSPAQRRALAQVLRTRLHEVSCELGARLPLYVVLSKFDQLDGFDPFYARLSAEKREDVLGFTFEPDATAAFDAWLGEFAEQYDGLLARVHEQAMALLQAQTCAEPRARMLSLLTQLNGLRPLLLKFLRETLASDPFNTPAWVRGVYWSSAVQRGELCNAFVRKAAQPYPTGLPEDESRAREQTLPHFIQHVFARVIYKESGLAGDNERVARSKQRLLWVGSGVGVLALAVAFAGWRSYFESNATNAAAVLAKSRDFSQSEVDQRLDPTGRNLLLPLDRISNAVAVFGQYREAWPGVADLGLYQGRVIGPLVDEVYLKLLSQRFLPAIASGVVEAMSAAPPGSDQQLEALRVYRMLEDRQNRRPAVVEQWMATQWQAAYPGQGQLQRDLMSHLTYALAYADAELPQFRQPVSEVQQSLREVPLAQRVYDNLKRQSLSDLHAGLDLRKQVGPAFDSIYQPASATQRDEGSLLLMPMLTAKGLRDYVEPRSQQLTDMAMIDQWVLGERRHIDYSTADRNALAERVRSLYSSDYIDRWQRALNALVVKDFRDLDHGVVVLEQLIGPATPLRRLLETVQENTRFPSLPTVTAKGELAAISPGQAAQAQGIHRAFADLNGLLQPKGEKPSEYEDTISAIANVHDFLRAIQGNPDRGDAALQAVMQRFSMTAPDPVGALQRVATGLPAPINHQVRKVAEQSARVLNIEAIRELDRRWDAEVYSYFQQRLAGRYPFVIQAPDASLDDFEAFFGPKGRLKRFQDQYLKLFLTQNFEALRADQQGGSLIRTDVVEQLEIADRIRETFFDQRGNLSVQFSIEPLGLSTNQRTSLLDLDGQLISYTHGPGQITGIVWPNTLGRQVRSNLTLLRLNGQSSSLEYRGPWSMFRLLSRGSLNGRTETSVDLSFRTADGVMRYRLSAQKAFNPITQQPFKDFRLPRGLMHQAGLHAERPGRLDASVQ
ncbi:type VI secretion system membrane subunit TssM [Pseudomonas sp. PSKL.D1]|uniref:type VI secretion system membrane subunit TssM n=1 Tax=Pseudomonas sp. PSKL.D1 TaxID=3029060 RepID=UPI0023810B7C|nr:type VI secretion system membrane subunit TssM [Pseudomonas sp. PSKL.D1]WDY59993.1 type VI secretion system membrane subunit TssM [Pseudomonas sp. PSKL.D1]